jgi:molybdate transport system regulatory protein
MARVSVSIVFDGARIGPGKAKLLENIRDTGSISAAACDMGTLQPHPRPGCDQCRG